MRGGDLFAWTPLEKGGITECRAFSGPFPRVTSMTKLTPAARVGRIQTSPSTLASQRARELKAEGQDIIALSSGEPDFQTPDHIVEAAYKAMKAGQTKYTTVTGTADLKAAIVEKFRRENGIDYKPEEIMVSTGAKQVLVNALMATVGAGDEVIIPAPYWISYAQIVQLGSGTPISIPCPVGTGFKLTPQALERAITPRTKWLMLNSPSNPSGAVYSAADLRALADVLLKHPNIWILSDDIYEHIVFDGRKVETIVGVEPRLKDRTVTVNGVSKAYAMTGWRIGYCGAPTALIREMTKLQSQCTSGPSSIGQAAAVAALTGPQHFVAERAKAFQDRRDLVVSMLNQARGIHCPSPEGAFYVYPSCAELIGKRTPEGKVIANDSDFVMYLMDSHGVAVVQGEAYGISPHFRISFAASTEDLTRACERIQRAAAELT